MKTKNRTNPVHVDADNDLDYEPSAFFKPTHEEISVVAQQLYNEDGRPGGLAHSYWEAAEAWLQQQASKCLK